MHPRIAVRILDKMSFLEEEITIIRAHHEKWNGRGYPDGAANTSIPLGARILSVADAFDALTSNRSYHKSRPPAEAIRILVDSSGYDFDPEIVEIMVSWVEQVSSQLGDTDQLTPEDLRDSQERRDDKSTPEIAAQPCATEG